MHLNIHSLYFHIDEFRIALKLHNLQFDFICITETKIIKNIEPLVDITIDGYQYPVGTLTEATKGSVLIYVKEGIEFKPREDLNIYKPKELESYFLETIDSKEKTSLMGCIHRHPCMEQATFIDDYLEPLNDKLINESKKIFLAGDFNFDLLKSDKDEPINFFETMMPCHLLPTITLPTKINDKRSTIIDNIFTNEIHPDMKFGSISINISDHLPSFFIIPTDNQNHLPNKQNLYTRKTKNFDRINFLLDYLDIDWNIILKVNQNDANISIQIFLTKINSLLDKYH